MFIITVPSIEEFEDIKGVIRIFKSKKSKQQNDQKKKYKRANNDLQNIHHLSLVVSFLGGISLSIDHIIVALIACKIPRHFRFDRLYYTGFGVLYR